MPEFYMTFARKIFSPYFYGGRDKCPPLSVTYAYEFCVPPPVQVQAFIFSQTTVLRLSAVVENVTFLCRSLYLPYEVPHWLYISKFTRLRAVSRRQHGSCNN